MSCNEALRALRRRFDGEADAPPAALEHLSACADCRRAARSDEVLREWFASLPRPAAPAGLTGRVLLRVRRTRGLRPILRLAAAAAAVLLVATGSALLFAPAPAAPAHSRALSYESTLDLLLVRTAADYAAPARREEDR